MANGERQGSPRRGGFEVDLEWKEGKLEEAVIQSKLGGNCNLRYGEFTQTIAMGPGESLVVDGALSPR